MQAAIPDPNSAETFLISKLDWGSLDDAVQAGWLAYYRHLLKLRQETIVPRLHGMDGSAGEIRSARAGRIAGAVASGRWLSTVAAGQLFKRGNSGRRASRTDNICLVSRDDKRHAQSMVRGVDARSPGWQTAWIALMNKATSGLSRQGLCRQPPVNPGQKEMHE